MIYFPKNSVHTSLIRTFAAAHLSNKDICLIIQCNTSLNKESVCIERYHE